MSIIIIIIYTIMSMTVGAWSMAVELWRQYEYYYYYYLYYNVHDRGCVVNGSGAMAAI